MKKRHILFILAVLLLSTACSSSWLEEKRFDKVDTDNLYKSEDGLKSALTGLYSLTRRYFRFKDGDDKGTYWFYCAHDLAQVRTYNEAEIYRNNMRATAMSVQQWNRPYQIIDRASAIITSARTIDMRPSERERITAEAKVMRAWAYLRLFTIYDNILLDTIPTTPKNAFDSVEYKPAKKSEIFFLINNDLDYAISKLSYKTTAGTISQGLARQLRCQAALWQEDYRQAADQCDAIINSGIYSLVPISEVFGDNVNNKETIFAFQFDELTGGSAQRSGGDGHNIGAALQARYYEITLKGEKTLPIIECAEYGGNSFSWTTPNDYLRSLYTANDKRLLYYFYPDTLKGTNPNSKWYGKTLPGNPPYSTQYRRYAWSVMKYRDLNKRPKTAVSFKPLVMYRLAETYLAGAEAHMKLGEYDKALEYINKVRNRAGIGSLSSITMQDIMDEEARELCFEGKRWFFLKRIGKLVEQVNKHLMYGSTRTALTHMSMKSYQVRWPIPQVQINAMGTFPQNEGY